MHVYRSYNIFKISFMLKMSPCDLLQIRWCMAYNIQGVGNICATIAKRDAYVYPFYCAWPHIRP